VYQLHPTPFADAIGDGKQDLGQPTDRWNQNTLMGEAENIPIDQGPAFQHQLIQPHLPEDV
jgi:hypothetical protein